MSLERDLGYIYGARFFRQDGVEMFTFGIDPNNVIGPREATQADRDQFPGEHAKFLAEKPQLDHDGDGKAGGSPKPEGENLTLLRHEYKALAGKKAFGGWGGDELRKRIAELSA